MPPESQPSHTERSTSRPRSTKRVRIVGDHPHRGAAGTIRDDLPMQFGMWNVDLDDSHAQGCFAGPENLTYLDPSEDPRA